MSDPLDRAVDARIDAYRPATVPPFAALEARKRGRDRRRALTGGALLSVVAVAAAGAVGAGLGGGPDRLESPGGVAGPAATPTVDIADVPLPQRYSVTFTDAVAYRGAEDDALVSACMELPGTSERVVDDRRPPLYGVTVTGARAVEAFTTCVESVDNTTLALVVMSIPIVVPDAAGPVLTFRVGVDVTSTFQPEPAAFTAQVETCLALPGVTGVSVQESFPATYEVTARGSAADALASCLFAVVGADVQTTGGSPADGPGLEAFINRCVGAENPILVPQYLGLGEDEATRAGSRTLAKEVRTVRVIGRDGACLGRTRDLRADRVNLLLVDGNVVWAGRF